MYKSVLLLIILGLSIPLLYASNGGAKKAQKKALNNAEEDLGGTDFWDFDPHADSEKASVTQTAESNTISPFKESKKSKSKQAKGTFEELKELVDTIDHALASLEGKGSKRVHADRMLQDIPVVASPISEGPVVVQSNEEQQLVENGETGFAHETKEEESGVDNNTEIGPFHEEQQEETGNQGPEVQEEERSQEEEEPEVLVQEPERQEEAQEQPEEESGSVEEPQEESPEVPVQEPEEQEENTNLGPEVVEASQEEPEVPVQEPEQVEAQEQPEEAPEQQSEQGQEQEPEQIQQDTSSGVKEEPDTGVTEIPVDSGKGTVTLAGSIEFDTPFENFDQEKGKKVFIDSLASLVNVDSAAVRVTNIRKGSVIFDFEITSTLSTPLHKDATVISVQNIDKVINQATRDGRLNIFDNAPVLNYKRQVLVYSPPEGSEPKSMGWIVAIAAFFSFVILGLICWLLYKQKKLNNEAKLKDVKYQLPSEQLGRADWESGPNMSVSDSDSIKFYPVSPPTVFSYEGRSRQSGSPGISPSKMKTN